MPFVPHFRDNVVGDFHEERSSLFSHFKLREIVIVEPFKVKRTGILFEDSLNFFTTPQHKNG
jgi:hypothetical protein